MATTFQIHTGLMGWAWGGASAARAEGARFASVGGEGNEMPFYHESILLDEVVEYLEPTEGKLLVDGTLGGGGHTEALLRGGAWVKGIDRDVEARNYASERLEHFGDRFEAVAGRFSEMEQ